MCKLPYVSIFWVNYNSYVIKNIVKASLKSVMELDYPCYEVIIVDNGSNDGSWELINDWLRKFGVRDGVRVKKIRLSKNYGFTGGNNFAYKFIDRRSKYIALINNDAIVLKNSLRKLIEFMEANPKVGASQGVILRPDLKIDNAGAYLNEFLASIPAYMGRSSNEVKQPYYVTYASGTYCVYRVEALIKAGLKDKIFDWEFFAYYDDNVLGLKLWQSGYRIVATPYITAIHIGSATFGKYTFRKHYHGVLGWVALNEVSNSKLKRLNKLLILSYALRASLLSLVKGGTSKQTPIQGFIVGLKIASKKKDRIDLYKSPILNFPIWVVALSIFLRRVLNTYLIKINPQETFRYKEMSLNPRLKVINDRCS